MRPHNKKTTQGEKKKMPEKKIEEEMMTNPKAEEMCEFEEKHYPKCNECSRQIDDQIFCSLNTMKWRLSNLEKTQNQIIIILKQIRDQKN